MKSRASLLGLSAGHCHPIEGRTLMISTLLVAGSLFAADPPDFAKDSRPAGRGEATGKSINGKSLASLRDKVKELWPTIVFEKEGKPVEYVVTFETEDGPIEIEFFPKLA